MRAKTTVLVIFLFLFVIASALPGCVTTKNEMSGAPTRYKVAIANVTVYAEAANTPQQQQQGLMNRKSLNENAGMLFILPKEERPSVWMKNVIIPLDVIFITADLRVLEIYRSVPPCAGILCPLYTPSAPIKYVLEVNAGLTDRHGVKVGDAVLVAPVS